MNIIIFGASGMVGQAVLRECLLSSDVTEVLAVGRSSLGRAHEKLKELIQPDLFNLDGAKLSGFDACFFSLGSSSAGQSEQAFARINYELPSRTADLLAKLNPKMVFVYVSGLGTDSTEKGRVMWARVKGKTENHIMKLPLRGAYMFRPGFIVPMNGEVAKTPLYRYFYKVMRFLLPVLTKAMPSISITTEHMGRAFLSVARTGSGTHLVESSEIKRLGSEGAR